MNKQDNNNYKLIASTKKMESEDFIAAAIAMDNHRLGRTDIVDYSSIQRLSEQIYNVTSPGSNKDYPGLSYNLNISAFMKPVEGYFNKKFEQGSKIKDLADKLIIISENLDRFALHEEEIQRKLMNFCVEISRQLMAQKQIYRIGLAA